MCSVISKKSSSNDFIFPYRPHELLINDAVIPLSVTGISPRTYLHWKKEGLVFRSPTTKRGWVKLSLIEYFWLKIVQTLRDFGLPLPIILKVKDKLLIPLRDLLEDIEVTDQKFEMTPEQWLATKKKRKSEEYLLETLFGAGLRTALFHQSDGILLIDFDGKSFNIDFVISESKLRETENNRPQLRVSLKPLIDDFFELAKAPELLESTGLINQYESKTLETISKSEFHEIIITARGTKSTERKISPQSSKLQRQNIIRELTKIFGLNSYKSIKIEFKNKKYVIFENKDVQGM